MEVSAEKTKDLWLKPIYCSQMSTSSFVFCSLPCSSLVRGVRSPVFVVTPLTWHSTMKLQPWVSGQMSLSHMQAAPLEDESEQKEKKADFGAQCLHTEHLFFYNPCSNTEMQSKGLLETWKNQNIGKKHVCGPSRSRRGWRWTQVVESLWTVLIDAVCEAGQSGGWEQQGSQLKCS